MKKFFLFALLLISATVFAQQNCGTVTDYEGHVYSTVKIGQQCWMTENLRTTHYADGVAIPMAMIYNGVNANTDTVFNLATYGRLYDWNSATRGITGEACQGACPNGWRLPTVQEFQALENAYTPVALRSTNYWLINPGNNTSGFDMRPGGLFNGENGRCENLGGEAYFYSSSMQSSMPVHLKAACGCWELMYNTAIPSNCFSVRCVKEDETPTPPEPTTSLPTITTTAASEITATTATAGGNVTADGGATVTARGICWSTSETPTVADNVTTDGTGTGSFASSITGLTANTTYYVRAYATNSEGTAYGEQVSFTTMEDTPVTPVDGQPCPGAATVTDYDNNTYNTVLIGEQCWMKENLKTTHYSDGTAIELGSNTSTETAYRYCPNNSSDNVATYGYLYNWKAVMHNSSSSATNPSGVQGICPTGWHVPSDGEWTQLTNYVKTQSAFHCGSSSDNIAKALASTSGWPIGTETCAVGSTPSSNNATGFSGVTAGLYGSYGYDLFGEYAGFWSATQSSSPYAYVRYLYYDSPYVYDNDYNKDDSYSVRCLKDENGGTTPEPTADLPTVTTSAVSDITATTATAGGNVTADGGATVSARGICWSTSETPTIADNVTTDGTGTGEFTSSITGITANTTYYVRAYATNSEGTAYGEQVSFTTLPADGQSCGTLTDYDGNTYNTVQIGDQCWMKENLRTTHYSNGTIIALGSTTSTSKAYRYYPDNNSENVATYGYLYNWAAVMHNSSASSANPSGVKGICPLGWHVPSDGEWAQLKSYVNNQSDYMCQDLPAFIAKSLASTSGWNSSASNCAPGNNPSSNNATGFSAVPAGYYTGSYLYFGDNAYFWSTTEGESSNVYSRHIEYSNGGLFGLIEGVVNGCSVRCLKDENDGTTPESTTDLPSVTTKIATSITATTATAGGIVTEDGNATVTARGICWSTSEVPTLADNVTTDGTGMGEFNSSLTGLTAATTYYVRAYATNSVGTEYGEQLSFTTLPADGRSCGTLTDYDGNTYNTVQIGEQCWMKENLRTTHYSNGAEISLGDVISDNTAYRYYPNNNSENVATYGYLYNWAAVMRWASASTANPSGVQGICPTGWHVPSKAEWTQLTNYVKTQSAFQCGSSSDNIAKALASTNGWVSSTSSCTPGKTPADNNATGFSAVPAGRYRGGYEGLGGNAIFWSASQYGVENAYYRAVGSGGTEVYDFYLFKNYGLSVRCLKNVNGGTTPASTTALPTVTTTAVSEITQTTATVGGNVTANGNATVTARGICWSTSQNPTILGSHTSNSTGTGSFTSNITGLTSNTTYYVRAYATNCMGIAYGEQVSFKTTRPADGQSCGTLTDYDGNTYNTVQIGEQCWMKENLKTTHFGDGTEIALGSTSSTETAYRYCPNNNSSNVATYGYLYNWPAVMNGASSSSANPSGIQGICPTGWHVPSDEEWTQLTDYVSSQSSYQCSSRSTYIAKALASTSDWSSSTYTCAVGNTPSDNNATGFSAVPAGSYYYNNGSYIFSGSAYFWSATLGISSNAYYRGLSVDNPDVITNFSYISNGYSVRCLRN